MPHQQRSQYRDNAETAMTDRVGVGGVESRAGGREEVRVARVCGG